MSNLNLKSILEHIEEIAMATLLAFMTLLTFAQVVLRYVFNSGWVWSLEATTYSFAALVLVGMSYGVRTNSHIAVDLITRRLPPAIGRIAAITAIALCLLYCGMMLYGSAVFVDRLATLGNDARDIPVAKWILTLVMPIGFALLSIRFLMVGWDIVAGTHNAEKIKERGKHS
jgi:C4-dicarboxylate transporter DctQ subunit